MKKLYCPWREQYSSSINTSKKEDTIEEHCVFCTQFAQKNDSKHYILKRFRYCAAMLNLYPYNAGHILIVPFGHVACLSTLSSEERTELINIASITATILNTTLNAQGTNIGLNLGKAAGAGIPSHLHMHVLPRWHGDTNFLPTLSETKTISFDLNDIYKKLLEAYKNI